MDILNAMLNNSIFWTIIVVFVYVMLVLVVRWNFIAEPTKSLLCAQLLIVRKRLLTDQEHPETQNKLEKTIIPHAEEILNEAENNINKSGVIAPVMDRLFWCRGHELKSWRLIHEVERMLVDIYPEKRVDWRLKSALVELNNAEYFDESAKSKATDFAKEIKASIDGSSDLPTKKAALQQALRFIYDFRDDYFDGLVTWHNKSIFLLITGLTLIVALASSIGFALFFLMGAVGGFLSRLSRSLQTKGVPVDYGAYWTTLLLSPIAGALAGWVGILVIDWLSAISILSKEFAGIKWPIGTDTISHYSLAAAFILGFSERMLMNIIKPIEEKVALKQMEDKE